MPKSSKSKKHPSEMNTEEALNHLFHPKIVNNVKELVANPQKPKRKAATKERI
jgi:hypothetical protein